MRSLPPILRILALAAAVAATSFGPVRGADARVLHALLDHEGLPALHNTIEDGQPKMWLPQLRLFDAAGRPLWSLDRMPDRRRDFRRDFRSELERRVEERQPLAEGRTLRQEAQHLLRRGGLPLNLTTLEPSDLTIIEYWTADCQQCSQLSAEVDRFVERSPLSSIQIIRVFIPLGP